MSFYNFKKNILSSTFRHNQGDILTKILRQGIDPLKNSVGGEGACTWQQ